MTNSELVANYENIKVDFIETHKDVAAKMAKKADEWVKAIGNGVSVGYAGCDGMTFTLVDNDGDKHDLALGWRNSSWDGKGVRMLYINPASIGSFTCHDDYQFKYFSVVSACLKNLAKWEKELANLVDWKSFDDKEYLFYIARDAVENAERDARHAAEEAKKADILSKLVKGAKLHFTRTNRDAVIDYATPKFVNVGWNKYRKSELVLDILAGRIVFAA